jgi:hypothetical protein
MVCRCLGRRGVSRWLGAEDANGALRLASKCRGGVRLRDTGANARNLAPGMLRQLYPLAMRSGWWTVSQVGPKQPPKSAPLRPTRPKGSQRIPSHPLVTVELSNIAPIAIVAAPPGRQGSTMVPNETTEKYFYGVGTNTTQSLQTTTGNHIVPSVILDKLRVVFLKAPGRLGVPSSRALFGCWWCCCLRTGVHSMSSHVFASDEHEIMRADPMKILEEEKCV